MGEQYWNENQINGYQSGKFDEFISKSNGIYNQVNNTQGVSKIGL